VVYDHALRRRGLVVAFNDQAVTVQWTDRHGVQRIPAEAFTADRYEVLSVAPPA